MALACLVVGLAASPAAAKRDMRCNGAALLCSRHFDRVVLPGAHNAMSAASLGWKIPNQSVAIPDQLETGIRALLIDTHYGRLQPDGTVKTDDNGRVTEGELGTYLCHEVCEIGATPLVPALRHDPQVRPQATEQRARDRSSSPRSRPTTSRPP